VIQSKNKKTDRPQLVFFMSHPYINVCVFFLHPTHAFSLFFLCALLAFSQHRQTTTWSVSLSNHTQTHAHTRELQAVGWLERRKRRCRGWGRAGCSRLFLWVSDLWLSIVTYTDKTVKSFPRTTNYLIMNFFSFETYNEKEYTYINLTIRFPQL